MKQGRFLLFLGLMLFAGAFAAKAQHYCDLGIQVITPAGGAVIENGATQTIQVGLVNLGPDTFYTTDTMFISGNLLNLPAGAVAMGTPNTPMPPGATSVINFPGPVGTILNDRTATTDTTVERCVRILTGNLLEPPGSTQVFDTLPGNNRGCVTITLKGASVTGIEKKRSREMQQLQLYPNPALDKVSFAIAPETATGVKVTIRDMAGRTIVTQNYEKVNAGPTVLHMAVATLPNGIYLTEVQTNTGKQIGKLIIRR